VQGRFSFYMTCAGEEAAIIASAAGLDPKDQVRVHPAEVKAGSQGRVDSSGAKQSSANVGQWRARAVRVRSVSASEFCTAA
jgi:hypothetical protein